MGWRIICITKRSKLDLRLGNLVVRSEGSIKIPLSEIGMLLIENTSCTITSALLSELAKQKVKVIFCDEKHNPICESVPYVGSHDSSKSMRNQIAWPKERTQILWTKIVLWKIEKQRDHLIQRNLEEAKILERYIQEVELGDSTNREGHAAKVYFNGLWGKKFSRDNDNPVNSALNYGYSLLLSSFNKQIVSLGYLTQLGIWHNNQFNPFNLSSDLMEPFRPLVDQLVFDLAPTKFGPEEKKAILSLFQIQVLIKNEKQYLNNSIRIFTKSATDFLNGKIAAPLKCFDVV